MLNKNQKKCQLPAVFSSILEQRVLNLKGFINCQNLGFGGLQDDRIKMNA